MGVRELEGEKWKLESGREWQAMGNDKVKVDQESEWLW